MFIISNYLRNRRQKLLEWEDAKKKWLSENDYRRESSWHLRHPRPGMRWGSSAGSALLTIAIFAATLSLGLYLNSMSSPQEEAQISGIETNCKDFNMNDYVRVQYGTYADTEGEIVGGCEEGTAYQVRLSEGSRAKVPNDGISEAVDVGGRTIGVDASRNLSVVEKSE